MEFVGGSTVQLKEFLPEACAEWAVRMRKNDQLFAGWGEADKNTIGSVQ
jgi:hypothetical protein